MSGIKLSYDHIRTWSEGPFRLELFDTYQCIYGRSRLAFQFFYGEALIFEGDDFCPSPLHSIDSNNTVASLLAFLSLRPGDTDPDYFQDYTPAQLSFALSYGEELALLAQDLEEQD